MFETFRSAVVGMVLLSAGCGAGVATVDAPRVTADAPVVTAGGEAPFDWTFLVVPGEGDAWCVISDFRRPVSPVPGAPCDSLYPPAPNMEGTTVGTSTGPDGETLTWGTAEPTATVVVAVLRDGTRVPAELLDGGGLPYAVWVVATEEAPQRIVTEGRPQG